MATQQGFEYERNAYEALRKPTIHKDISTGELAGASHDKPDLTIKVGKITSGVELKNQPTAAGSLVLQFSNGKWNFGPTDGNVEKEFLKSVGTKAGVLKTLNANWTNPVLQYDEDGKKIYVGAKKSEAYRKDLAAFGKYPMNVRYINVPTKIISDYYNKKDTYYLNVGSHGFFLFNTDPLGINAKLTKEGLAKVPNFSSPNAATTKIRIRVQDKSGSYQISFTLQFGMTTAQKSPYNIAPLKSGSKSEIDTKSLIADPIMRVL
jgi:hypothetical protein